MPTVEYAGRAVRTSDEGFLLDPAEWTREVAEAIAKEAGVWPLTDAHWTVIDFCRADARREGQPPGLRRISTNSGVDMKTLYKLFPKGPGRLAARIAGLPKPQSCV